MTSNISRIEAAIRARDLPALTAIFSEAPYMGIESIPIDIEHTIYPICFAIQNYADETEIELDIIRFLIQDDTENLIYINRYDSMGTPLNHAIYHDRRRICSILIQSRPGWVTIKCSKKANPLFRAARFGRCEILTQLILHLLQTHQESLESILGLMHGTSLLHAAASNSDRNWEVISFLLWLGADPLLNANGITPLVGYIRFTQTDRPKLPFWKAIIGLESYIVEMKKLWRFGLIVHRNNESTQPLEEDFILEVRGDVYFTRSLTEKLLLHL